MLTKLVDITLMNIKWPRSCTNTIYNARYKLFTEIVHLTTHTACKNHNYLSTLENDMIPMPNYSLQAYWYIKYAKQIITNNHKQQTCTTARGGRRKVRPLSQVEPMRDLLGLLTWRPMAPTFWLGLERAWRKLRKAMEEMEKMGGRERSERKSQRDEKS